MGFFLFFLSFLWFIRETKSILFWLYLWQLKEYRISRFLDHFRTEKGKRIFLNTLFFFKIFLLLIFLTTRPGLVIIYVLLILYLLESVKFSLDIWQRKLIKPIFTKKLFFLTFVNLVFLVFYFLAFFQKEISFVFCLLISDIFTPVIASGIVLIFQPLAVFGRNRIIKNAIKKREQFKDLIVIGITGSYGKTSTKEFLATILSEKFKVLKTKEHQNTEVGVSQCILNDLKLEHEIFVCEMGAYNRGEIKLICDIVKPKIGILTGINEQHMAIFGSLENIIKTKYELIESLPEDGIAFFNGKNKYCLELYQKTKIKKKIYGQDVKLAGLENIEGAQALARELGMSEEEISRGTSKIKNKFPGVEVKKGINGLNIINASYSANPDGVISHLEYLKIWQARKIIVMPCLIELGSVSEEVHKRLGRKIGEVCDLAIITTRDKFKEIKDGSTSSPRGDATEILFIEDPKEIFEKIKNFSKAGDIVILEGRVSAELVKTLTG